MQSIAEMLQDRLEDKYNDHAGADLFTAVKAAVSKCSPEWPGQEFVLLYGRGRAEIREVRGDDW